MLLMLLTAQKNLTWALTSLFVLFLTPENILCLWKCRLGGLRGNNCCFSLSLNAEVWKEEDALERQGGNMILGQICVISSEFYCVCFAN